MDSGNKLTDKERLAAGQRLREIREATTDTVTAFASLAGVTVKTVTSIEAGNPSRPSTIRKIARNLQEPHASELRKAFKLGPVPKSGAVTGMSESADDADLREAIRALRKQLAEVERRLGER